MKLSRRLCRDWCVVWKPVPVCVTCRIRSDAGRKPDAPGTSGRLSIRVATAKWKIGGDVCWRSDSGLCGNVSGKELARMRPEVSTRRVTLQVRKKKKKEKQHVLFGTEPISRFQYLDHFLRIDLRWFMCLFVNFTCPHAEIRRVEEWTIIFKYCSSSSSLTT